MMMTTGTLTKMTTRRRRKRRKRRARRVKMQRPRSLRTEPLHPNLPPPSRRRSPKNGTQTKSIRKLRNSYRSVVLEYVASFLLFFFF